MKEISLHILDLIQNSIRAHLLRYIEIVTRNAGEVKGKSAAGLFQNAKVAQMRFLCYNKMSTECSLADIPRSDTLRIYRGAQAAPF